ncbi:heavy metal-binding domain-containing protein [Candidatus Solirubrobacter pratensis]|uniref:heavy metal-binding domain-containing protein n=1 Tax=Candidatus Solirubrobacter pratensis TaxID=1298857 RepID=UPI0004198AAA|nr:heavy metal-binding domain-containing protein [Candidatus Solirubrobacter pratensis]
MGFLDRLLGGGDGEDPAAQEDVARVERGGIPLAAERRIRELAGGDAAFTSGLSIADFALSRLDGVRPVCQVMGSSVYKVGWQSYPWGSGWGGGSLTELRPITDAWNHARRLALGRLEEEARLAGCHAVVDVMFKGNRHEFLSGDIEIVVNGTAVHLPEGGDAPVLTDLSLPDYTLLRRAGYRPVGVVASTSVFYIVPGRQTRQATTGWQRFQPNQELPDFTQGVYAAREMALARATEQASRLRAGGLIGVSIDHDIAIREVDNGGKREDLIVTFHIVGTAIAPAGEHLPLDPMPILRQGAK